MQRQRWQIYPGPGLAALALATLAVAAGPRSTYQVVPLPPAPQTIVARKPQEGARAHRSDAVVQAQATAQGADASGVRLVTLTLAIEPGWHLYANPVGKEPVGMPTTLTVAGARPEEVRVEYPPGRLVKDDVAGDHYVYEGRVTIRAEVRRPPGPLDVNVKVQACTKTKCLMPATLTLTVP